MEIEEKEESIHELAEKHRKSSEDDHIIWSRHAIKKLIEEGVERSEVEDALRECEVIENYPQRGRELPDCLCLGYLSPEEPVHSVVAIDRDLNRLLIVTVYSPDRREWENDWKTRKR